VLVSHYENNYVGAVRRLNTIGAQIAELDYAKAPNFVVNGLKREELIAMNSMILHEIYFDGLGGAGRPGALLRPSRVTSAALTVGARNFRQWARHRGVAPVG
jgi:Fe-Mn family superoxide dismutase